LSSFSAAINCFAAVICLNVPEATALKFAFALDKTVFKFSKLLTNKF